jgi:hypothetical protein
MFKQIRTAAGFLLVMALAAVAAALFVRFSGRPLASSARRPPAAVDGAAMLAQARAALERHASVTARVRQRGTIFGLSFAAIGSYVQGPAAENLLRWELRYEIDGRDASVEIVGDGNYLWQRRQLSGNPSLFMTHARDVERAMTDAGQGGPTGLASVGGLPRLLDGLARSFTFTEGVSARLRDEPVVGLVGRWKPEVLVRAWPQVAERVAAGKPVPWRELPEHLPDQVLVFLDQRTQFPVRFEFRRTGAPDAPLAATEPGAARPLVVMELYDVRFNDPLDVRQFAFQPGDQPPEDVTLRVAEGRKSGL